MKADDPPREPADKPKLVITAADVAVTPDPPVHYPSRTRSAQSTGTGPVMLGDYKIIGLAGRGGMGVVYKAEQISLSRTVALKVLKAELTTAGDFRTRFLREARLAASVDHPNVVTVYDVGEDGGQLFLVMQWVPGSDLRTILGRDGALDPFRVSMLVRQIAGALDAVHGAGLLHRDIKPSNVLVRRVGTQDHAYLSDFGVAVAPDAHESLTGSGAIVGTTGYISPEQIMGQSPDGRSDLYALGCLTFEALTGQPPFRADNELGLRWAHVHHARPVASELSPALGANYDDFLIQALSVDAAERFPSGEAFAEAFMDAKRGEGVRVVLKGSGDGGGTASGEGANGAPPTSAGGESPGAPRQTAEPPPVSQPPAGAESDAEPMTTIWANPESLNLDRPTTTPSPPVPGGAEHGSSGSDSGAVRSFRRGLPARAWWALAVAAVIALAVLAVVVVSDRGLSERARVAQVLNQYQADLASGSFGQLKRLLDSDVVRSGAPGGCGSTRGLATALASLESGSHGSGAGYQLVDLTPKAVSVHGRTASVLLHFRTTAGTVGAVRFGLVNQGGSWRITRITSECGSH